MLLGGAGDEEQPLRIGGEGAGRNAGRKRDAREGPLERSAEDDDGPAGPVGHGDASVGQCRDGVGGREAPGVASARRGERGRLGDELALAVLVELDPGAEHLRRGLPVAVRGLPVAVRGDDCQPEAPGLAASGDVAHQRRLVERQRDRGCRVAAGPLELIVDEAALVELGAPVADPDVQRIGRIERGTPPPQRRAHVARNSGQIARGEGGLARGRQEQQLLIGDHHAVAVIE